MMKELLIRSHLGLGDGLIINALVRHFAKDHDVTLLCKKHNQVSLSFMFRDCPRINLMTTDNDRDLNDDDLADAGVRHVKEHGKKALCLGMYGDRKIYDERSWDRSIYQQAGLDFQLRWNEFKCARQPSCEIEVPHGKFAFVHDDADRGFVIPQKRLPKKLNIVRPEPGATENIFAYWGLLEQAQDRKEIESWDHYIAFLLHSNKSDLALQSISFAWVLLDR